MAVVGAKLQNNTTHALRTHYAHKRLPSIKAANCKHYLTTGNNSPMQGFSNAKTTFPPLNITTTFNQKFSPPGTPRWSP